jgi:hypothetical protein
MLHVHNVLPRQCCHAETADRRRIGFGQDILVSGALAGKTGRVVSRCDAAFERAMTDRGNCGWL